MILSSYTKSDVHFIKTNDEYDHHVSVFKRNLIIELKENYKLEFNKIRELLGDSYTNVRSIYLNHHDR